MNTTEFLEKNFTDAMKSIARREDLKAYIEQIPLMYQLLQRASAKYVAGDHREAGLAAAEKLVVKGYAVSIEFIGENTIDVQSCEAAVLEMSKLIQELSERSLTARVSFDLSHIGLSVNGELAFKHLLLLAEQAQQVGIELFISMEESEKTEDILAIYRRAVDMYPNIGITLQAQLNRTVEDSNSLKATSHSVRLVKGAYQELQNLAIPRSKALNERYLQLVEQIISGNHRLSIATHDEIVVDEIIKRGWAQKPSVEFEMLYGIRADLSSKLKRAGYPVRIYITYGQEWYLYLCHRIAEHPPNLYQAVIDIAADTAVDSTASYE